MREILKFLVLHLLSVENYAILKMYKNYTKLFGVAGDLYAEEQKQSSENSGE